MKRIESFEINHDLLVPGIYISRIDHVGDHAITTFDIRVKRPNCGDFMPLNAMHTIEHIGATFFRNSAIRDKVIYFGAMACSTGFYLVLAGDYLVKDGGKNWQTSEDSHSETIRLIIEMFRFLADFEGDVPGATRIECGNYKAHDLPAAKEIAREMLSNMSEFKFEYEN